MNKYYLAVLAVLWTVSGFSQKVTLSPTITPSLFRHNDEITVTYDVTGTTLASLTNAFIWVWIPGKNIDAKYNITPASSNATATDNAKFTKTVEAGKTLFSITFKPSDFFSSSIAAETKLGMLLKGNDWPNGQTTDFIADFWDGSFQIKLNAPTRKPYFTTNAAEIEVQAETPVDADFRLYVNEMLQFEEQAVKTFSYVHTVTENAGAATIKITATSGSNSSETSFQYIISSPSPTAQRPAGIIPGINYSSDVTTATLCLLAPDKASVYVRGDFSNWAFLPEFLMNRDGEYFWIELTGLTPGIEYAFQYLIDENVYVADPYTDKILDPDDRHISPTVYPDLKPYPDAALSENWYFNRLSVLQTNQPDYEWQVENFAKPDKRSLVVYELLIRDFFGSGNRTYKSLTDTITYLKRLGVNAVELLPIMEYNGNESWGYNPTFMFAPDKYYGPKNRLKEFIDKCHQEGIAVILDIAMNHQDMPNTYVMMDFDFDQGRPTLENKWFNPTARHPFNVFFDMNHESAYTKAYLDTVNHYWLNEYKVDGFRFDLSKGFTQRNNPNDVNAWSAYDDSRIAILKRMADKIWSHSPDAYVILEHLSVNSEEKELAEYRSGEGKGMMLWGNMNHAFNQLTMGYTDGADISGTSAASRSWSVPHLVSYMESHDEDRLMYRNMQFGNSAGNYTVKDKETSVQRIKAASVLFYAVPGPKMLWQFGEVGYDYNINYCEDGSINNGCRVSPKPVRWDYFQDGARYGLFLHTADLIKLHKTYSVFRQGQATMSSGNSLIKQVAVKNSPYTASPANTEQMNAHAVANLTLNQQAVAIDFPHTGIWYDYYAGGAPISVTSLPFQMQLRAGEYKLFTDVAIGAGPITSIQDENSVQTFLDVYPNPTTGKIFVKDGRNQKLQISDARGKAVLTTMGDEIDISHLPAGIYILMHTGRDGKRVTAKIIKQ